MDAARILTTNDQRRRAYTDVMNVLNDDLPYLFLWWPKDYKGPPLVSFEKKIAEGLGLKIGDPVVVNVLGRNIAATIANLRTVHWENLGINFVLVFSPNAFAGAPHTDIATLSYKGASTAEQEASLRDAGESRWTAERLRVHVRGRLRDSERRQRRLYISRDGLAERPHRQTQSPWVRGRMTSDETRRESGEFRLRLRD